MCLLCWTACSLDFHQSWAHTCHRWLNHLLRCWELLPELHPSGPTSRSVLPRQGSASMGCLGYECLSLLLCVGTRDKRCWGEWAGLCVELWYFYLLIYFLSLLSSLSLVSQYGRGGGKACMRQKPEIWHFWSSGIRDWLEAKIWILKEAFTTIEALE